MVGLHLLQSWEMNEAGFNSLCSMSLSAGLHVTYLIV